MNKYEIVQKIEKFAPLETQEKWDASGWIVDLKESYVNKILFALTITDQILEQAIEKGCDMIISHHPLFFVPLEYKKINMYCAHTNLDRAEGGTTDLIIQELGFKKTYNNDFVRVVELDKSISVEELKNHSNTISTPKEPVITNNQVMPEHPTQERVEEPIITDNRFYYENWSSKDIGERGDAYKRLSFSLYSKSNKGYTIHEASDTLKRLNKLYKYLWPLSALYLRATYR